MQEIFGGHIKCYEKSQKVPWCHFLIILVMAAIQDVQHVHVKVCPKFCGVWFLLQVEQ